MLGYIRISFHGAPGVRTGRAERGFACCGTAVGGHGPLRGLNAPLAHAVAYYETKRNATRSAALVHAPVHSARGQSKALCQRQRGRIRPGGAVQRQTPGLPNHPCPCGRDARSKAATAILGGGFDAGFCGDFGASRAETETHDLTVDCDSQNGRAFRQLVRRPAAKVRLKCGERSNTYDMVDRGQ